ncbi:MULTISPECIES: DsrE family protein [unclassified Acidiphilium]|uniref:DsrE family protein n=1 Tax=unclassified Acidiphilium TaxID=2617493 RepID=UPI000BD11C98|nr:MULTISPECIES: DsrE family protein [unclassified Acidiphilium]OYV55461.1 MAG: hypothetical protein B7Z76_10385 [Acidiphilium sp. 20-67-58]HQT60092.1 DsrE family protein [Acidiphilium sp.]
MRVMRIARRAVAVLATILSTILALAVSGGMARANPSMLGTFDFDHPAFLHANPAATRHVVIQVSAAAPGHWLMALNNAQNLLAALGAKKVQIVVVAFGPGLKMLLADSPLARRVAALDAQGVEFDACHNTMAAMARHLGHMPKLVPQAVVVPAGAERIVQLEAHGFAYLKP